MKLWAPAAYWRTPKGLREEITGGCGPGGIGDMLIPDTIWGLSVKPACAIHDWMYHFGDTDQHKTQADRVFLNNMLRIIKNKTKWKWLARLRIRRAKTYYFFVKHCGGPAFWDAKNPIEEFKVYV